jgi:hypothetical protein
MSTWAVKATIPANPQILFTGRTERRAKDFQAFFKGISTKITISHRFYTITDVPL